MSSSHTQCIFFLFLNGTYTCKKNSAMGHKAHNKKHVPIGHLFSCVIDQGFCWRLSWFQLFSLCCTFCTFSERRQAKIFVVVFLLIFVAQCLGCIIFSTVAFLMEIKRRFVISSQIQVYNHFTSCCPRKTITQYFCVSTRLGLHCHWRPADLTPS